MGAGSSGYNECYKHIVRFNEVDPYGIVHHSVYLVWAETGMQNYLSDAGLFTKYEVEKISCKYISPAHDRDEVTVRIRLDKESDVNAGVLFFSFEISISNRPLVRGKISVRKEGS